MDINTLINTVMSSDLENEVKVALLEILFEKRRELNTQTQVKSNQTKAKPYMYMHIKTKKAAT